LRGSGASWETQFYCEILWRAGHARRANDIPNAQFQANVAEAMERAARGVHKAHSLAEQIGEASFIAVMDKLQIESMTTIPKLAEDTGHRA
jgi:hypothetical protein